MGKEKAFIPCTYIYRGGAGEAPYGGGFRPAPAVLFDIVNPVTLAIPIAMAPCAPLAGSPDGLATSCQNMARSIPVGLDGRSAKMKMRITAL